MSFCDTINDDTCLLLRVDDDDDTTWNDCVRGTACNKPSKRNTQPAAKSRIVICVDETDMILLLLYLKNTGTVFMLIMS